MAKSIDLIISPAFIIQKLRTDKIITRKQLYSEYIRLCAAEDEKPKSFAHFDRQTRHWISTLTGRGLKIIRNNQGFHIAETEEEWNNYKYGPLRSKAKSMIEDIAKCENKTLYKVIQEMFFQKKKKEFNDNQLTFLEEKELC